MAQIKLTKTELRLQQIKLSQLQKYLPTLQLKKAMLQAEVNLTQQEIEQQMTEFASTEKLIARFSSLFSDRATSDFFSALTIERVIKKHENIAGVDIPIFEGIAFKPADYLLFDSPVWYEPAIDAVKSLLIAREKVKISQEKKLALEKELKEVAIRVNLFEKIMIPRAMQNIKKIKIFLGDQQLTAVSQAKVSKNKIELRNKELEGQTQR